MFEKHVLLSLSLITLIGCGGPVPTREEIAASYPDVEVGSARPENTRVLCPFLRMLERSGLFDVELASQPTATLALASVVSAANEFGCAVLECGAVAKIVSVGQGSRGVDLERLHDAGAISHDCGLAFGLGDTDVNPLVRQATLDRLADLADGDGSLAFEDIETVKLETCAAQGVEISEAGEIEIRLIFAYLGGVENGFVSLRDVERFLNATLPEVKTTSWIDVDLIARID